MGLGGGGGKRGVRWEEIDGYIPRLACQKPYRKSIPSAALSPCDQLLGLGFLFSHEHFWSFRPFLVPSAIKPPALSLPVGGY